MANKSPKTKTKALKMISFNQAVQEIMIGKKVTKHEWGTEEIYGFLNEGFLRLHKLDDKVYDWIISDGDLFGTDFYVI